MTVVLAILPVFLVIAAGWAARASGAIERAAWTGVNRLAYWVLFPALLFMTIAKADFRAVAAGPFALAAVGGFLTMGGLVLALRVLVRGAPGPTFTSLVQGGLRWNGVVLLAIAPSTFGPEGMALAALMFAPVVPLVNIISVLTLSIWGDGARLSPRGFAFRLSTNPLIVACALGWAANVTGVLGLAPPIAGALGLLANAGLAVGLLGIGAGLDLASLRGRTGYLALSVGLKLLVLPAILWLWARGLDLSPLASAVLVAGGATPGAAASYVLAKEMGGDAELTAAHVTASTILSLLTLTLWIWFATAGGAP